MKYLILFLISFSVMANYIPKEKIGLCEAITVYSKKSKCESLSGKECKKIPYRYNCEVDRLKPIMKDDLDSPLWGSRSMVEACSSEIDCQDKALLKVMRLRDCRQRSLLLPV